MERVVIIGAGAHGREVAEILRHLAGRGDDVQTLGFVDDDQSWRGRSVGDLPVLGDWSWFEGVDRREISVVCASGFSEARRRMAERATAAGLLFATAVSPLAYVSPSARVGRGVVMCQNSVAAVNALVGDHAIINIGAIVSHDTEVGRYATLNPGVSLAGNVSVGEGCYLGINCSVIQGIRIGPWTTVGAGAAVVRDLPGGVTAVGVPARIIKAREGAE